MTSDEKEIIEVERGFVLGMASEINRLKIEISSLRSETSLVPERGILDDFLDNTKNSLNMNWNSHNDSNADKAKVFLSFVMKFCKENNITSIDLFYENS